MTIALTFVWDTSIPLAFVWDDFVAGAPPVPGVTGSPMGLLLLLTYS